MTRERLRHGLPGIPTLLVAVLALAGIVSLFISGAIAADHDQPGAGWRILSAVILFPFWIFALKGFFMLAPKETKVMQLLGDYVGTAKISGLRYANPLYKKRKLSLRVRNFESGKLKVNDAEGNPIEIAAVVVWRVVETAEATFEVDNYEHYVHVQSEAALRNAATSYPYDSHEEHVVSLRGATAVVAEHLKKEVQQRLLKAGVEVLEARFSHMAYSQEIAAAMLQREQAGGSNAPRQLIVAGA